MNLNVIAEPHRLTVRYSFQLLLSAPATVACVYHARQWWWKMIYDAYIQEIPPFSQRKKNSIL